MPTKQNTMQIIAIFETMTVRKLSKLKTEKKWLPIIFYIWKYDDRKSVGDNI